jgi:F-type H+-transporting ATPase subunit c
MLKRVMYAMVAVAILASPALAAQAAKPAAESDATFGAKQYLGLGLALGIGIAAFGGAMGQGRAISGAVDAVARQPEAGGRIQGMMIIGLALIETLVIYTLLICLMWGGKLDPIAAH